MSQMQQHLRSVRPPAPLLSKILARDINIEEVDQVSGGAISAEIGTDVHLTNCKLSATYDCQGVDGSD